MSTERMVRVFAGMMILFSLVFALYISQWWLLLTGFVGVNLIQSAFTGICPAEKVLAKFAK